jgi:Uma2 family endonuclease
VRQFAAPTTKVAKHSPVWYSASMRRPSVHRFDVSAYYRLAEIGVLRPDAQVELLDGVVMDLYRISPLHAAVTRALAEVAFRQPEQSCTVSIHHPLRLDEFNELHPDVAILKFVPDYYKTRHPGPDDVLFLVEVADASLKYDREGKLPAYGRAGVPEVWIVNLDEMAIEIYREPNFGGYGGQSVVRVGDLAWPQAFPDMLVNVAELLKG